MVRDSVRVYFIELYHSMNIHHLRAHVRWLFGWLVDALLSRRIHTHEIVLLFLFLSFFHFVPCVRVCVLYFGNGEKNVRDSKMA